MTVKNVTKRMLSRLLASGYCYADQDTEVKLDSQITDVADMSTACTVLYDITSQGWSGTYDGQPHGITITIPDGAVIKYGTAQGQYDLDTAPTYTNAGSYTVYYQVSQNNRNPVTGSAAVEIDAKEIGIQWSTEPIYYRENTPQAPTATATGLVEYTDGSTDACTITVTGAATDVGTYTASAGSTIITFKTAYLEKLSTGKHSVRVHYIDGSTDGSDSFRIFINNGNPFTGDSHSMLLWSGMAMTSLLCLMMILCAPRRKGKYQK